MEVFFMKQNTLVSNIVKIESKEKEILKNVLLVLGGVAFLSLMAQIMIPLPYTPVPITLGTFGVTLMALLYGRKLGTATILSYVVAGSLGAPIFAGGKAGSLFSPTGGYILGYIVATIILGYLADRGVTKSYVKTILSLLLSSAIILTLGALVLSLFMPGKNAFMIGVLPFLPGDALKSTTVTLLLPTLWKFIPKNDKTEDK
ncbi:BioY family protein [Leptotrichia wadei]|uniref:Biotin transporter n=2 Tax=Leptotrichia wadei TaxID=157687 RepID=A0A134AES1_9FUSO|nr:BioY family protein [Leptotrichia wadei]